MKRASWVAIMTVTLVCVLSPAVRGDHDEGRGGWTYQTANMFQAGNPSNKLAGGATLLRSNQAVDMRIATSGLAMNAAYTVWWVVFNNPAGCTAPCGMDDVMNPAAPRTSVFYAAGFVTGMDGVGNVTAHLDAGALPEGVGIEVGSGLERGRGLTAEIHLVVRTHGAIIPGKADQQIGTFNGGCPPNMCRNEQAAVFMPVAP